MTVANHHPIDSQSKNRRIAAITFGIMLLVLLVGGLGQMLALRLRQADVAERGTQVMPFDLDQTHHTFESLPDGGLQTVVANDPTDTEQIALIQAHLQAEAEKFRRGDFSDPAAIHGHQMPGLAALRQSAGRIDVSYTARPNGAQIRYLTSDPELVTALHHWFQAQISDHGRHASGHE